jgi:hypothetical protein
LLAETGTFWSRPVARSLLAFGRLLTRPDQPGLLDFIRQVTRSEPSRW